MGYSLKIAIDVFKDELTILYTLNKEQPKITGRVLAISGLV